MAEDLPKKTISIPEAGELYFGIGRNTSYAAARRGEIPTIKIGRKIRVPVQAMENMMNLAPKTAEA
jgi:excisionase family DNA binding protein